MEFLVLGSLWFWILLSISAVLIIWDIEEGSDSGGWGATFIMVCTFLLLYFFGNKQEIRSVFRYIIDHPFKSFSFTFGYFFLGTIWSIIKWYFFLLNKRDAMKERKKDKYFWDDFKPVQAKDFKSKILIWMAYWPLSMVWTIINDPIKRIFRYIYDYISDFLQKISDHIFKTLVEEKNEKIKEAEQIKQQRISTVAKKVEENKEERKAQ